jgi:carbon storage regulator
MLVITRKAGDRVQIGDDITVTLLEISGSSVRLGIDAPAEVAVYRHEILQAVKDENRAASEANAKLPTADQPTDQSSAELPPPRTTPTP